MRSVTIRPKVSDTAHRVCRTLVHLGTARSTPHTHHPLFYHMAGHARPKAAEEPVMRSVATSDDPAIDSAARDMHPV